MTVSAFGPRVTPVLHHQIRTVLRQLEEATHTRGGLLLVREAFDPWPVTWASGGGPLFGAEGPGLADEPTLWWRAVVPDDREALREALDGERDDQVIEYRVRGTHSGVRWLRESVRRVRVEDGGIYLVSAVRDATLEREAAQPRPSPVGGGVAEAHGSCGEGDLVLLVEDDDAVRAVLARVLAREGLPTLLAASSAEALRVFERAPRAPAILVTDVVLPDRSGPELARALVRRRPDLPVLFISGYGADDLERRSELPAGARLLPKPFTPLDLVKAIRTALTAGAGQGGGGVISGPQSVAS